MSCIRGHHHRILVSSTHACIGQQVEGAAMSHDEARLHMWVRDGADIHTILLLHCQSSLIVRQVPATRHVMAAMKY